MATTRSITDAPWQSNKTVNECNKYMLEKELHTDVTFLVGNEETKVKEIKAHRYIFISRSPVFEAMLCGDLKENGPIKIPDTDWKTFMCFLRFLYYEDFPEDPSTILPLLYLAAKYIIPALEQKCEEKLKDSINTENVCIILEQGLFYEKADLNKDCMQFIRNNLTDVVKQKSFLDINQRTLKCILEDDQLHIPETELFESCVSWGKNQCEMAGKKQTGENIRSELGDALYCIRFPTFPANVLADIVAPLKILSEPEMLNLFIFINGLKAENKTPFSSKQRVELRTILYCERFQGIHSGWGHNGSADAITFETDKKILFHGIKVYVEENVDAKYLIQMKLFQLETCLGSVDCGASGGDLRQKEIKLDDPVPLSKDTKYDIELTMKGSSSKCVERGKGVVTSHGVTFHFSDSHRNHNGTSVSTGQIPGVLFSIFS